MLKYHIWNMLHFLLLNLKLLCLKVPSFCRIDRPFAKRLPAEGTPCANLYLLCLGTWAPKAAMWASHKVALAPVARPPMCTHTLASQWRGWWQLQWSKCCSKQHHKSSAWVQVCKRARWIMVHVIAWEVC